MEMVSALRRSMCKGSIQWGTSQTCSGLIYPSRIPQARLTSDWSGTRHPGKSMLSVIMLIPAYSSLSPSHAIPSLSLVIDMTYVAILAPPPRHPVQSPNKSNNQCKPHHVSVIDAPMQPLSPTCSYLSYAIPLSTHRLTWQTDPALVTLRS